MQERFEPFYRVKKKFELKKEKNIDVEDAMTRARIEFIENMLNNERCFFELQKSTALEILSFLGFNDDESFELYDQLTDYEVFRGNFNLYPDENFKK